MNKLIVSLSLVLSFAAAAQTPLSIKVDACKAIAGAHNPDEKAACIQVAVEDEVKACKANAGASNVEEGAACVKVALDTK